MTIIFKKTNKLVVVKKADHSLMGLYYAIMQG